MLLHWKLAISQRHLDVLDRPDTTLDQLHETERVAAGVAQHDSMLAYKAQQWGAIATNQLPVVVPSATFRWIFQTRRGLSAQTGSELVGSCQGRTGLAIPGSGQRAAIGDLDYQSSTGATKEVSRKSSPNPLFAEQLDQAPLPCQCPTDRSHQQSIALAKASLCRMGDTRCIENCHQLAKDCLRDARHNVRSRVHKMAAVISASKTATIDTINCFFHVWLDRILVIGSGCFFAISLTIISHC